MTAGQDLAIRQWNLFVVRTPDDARRRIERMHERWQAEESSVRAIA